MFGMGFTEILMIVVVAILFLGPEKLPDAMVSIAKFMKSVSKAIGDAKKSIDEELRLEDLKEEARNYKRELDKAHDELRGFKNIGINPAEEISNAINTAKTTLENPSATAKQIEPKRDEVTFTKTNSNNQTENKGGEA